MVLGLAYRKRSALLNDLLAVQLKPGIMPTNIGGISHVGHEADGSTEKLPPIDTYN